MYPFHKMSSFTRVKRKKVTLHTYLILSNGSVPLKNYVGKLNFCKAMPSPFLKLWTHFFSSMCYPKVKTGGMSDGWDHDRVQRQASRECGLFKSGMAEEGGTEGGDVRTREYANQTV